MRKYLIIAAAFGMVVGCNNNKKNDHEAPYYMEDEDVVVFTEPIVEGRTMSLYDSLEIKDNMGEVMEHEYEGTLPAADGPGIHYELEMVRQEKNDEGVFQLATTYLEADDDGMDQTFYTTGKVRKTTGAPGDNKAVVYELIPSDGSSRMYLLADGDDLTLLDQEKRRINSNLNYTLNLKK